MRFNRIFEVFFVLTIHTHSDFFGWVGGLFFTNENLWMNCRRSFFSKLILLEEVRFGNLILFRFVWFVETFKFSMGTANRQAANTCKPLGKAKRMGLQCEKSVATFAMVLHPRHSFFGVVLHWVAMFGYTNNNLVSSNRAGAISKRLLYIHVYSFVLQIMMCVIGSWCEAGWPWGTNAKLVYYTFLFVCVVCVCFFVLLLACWVLQ